MSMDPNVALVLQGFEYVRSGDVEGMASMWSEDVLYYAFDTHGQAAEYHGRTEAMEITRAGTSLMGPHSYELMDVRAVGSELVIVQARIHSTKWNAHEAFDGDYVGIFRVRGEKIVSCCDFIDEATETALDTAWCPMP